MTGKKAHTDLQYDLDDDDKAFITEIFFEEIVAKLKRMDARIGMLNCDFAGQHYGKWNIHFKSRGPGFEIVDFEYDEDSYSFNLEP